MSETYCGKSCGECTQKEELGCPGCKTGPGRQFGGECELAQCCRSKGHETCGTCGFNGNCGTLRTRDRQPEFRKRKMEAERQQKEAIAQRAPLLGKWLWILFWLIVPATVAGILGNNSMAKIAPGVYVAGRMLGAVCTAAYGVILLKLAFAEDRYRTSGICALIAAGANLLMALMSGASVPAWSLLISLPTAVVALVGEYNEYQAHSIILTDVDNRLAGKWSVLWKWYVGFLIGMFGCILLIVIVPVLGLIALIAVAIGTVVVSVLKLVYLYRTAKLFRSWSA